ncbi:hypothetical protein COM24_07085 [Bacillus toyonensis]|uniref:hypothetical protein n=1 Tax=Bacillus TaxID=1386 RepID=UPI000BF9E30E|nr:MULTISPECIES: hypothetical protein [Bacillus cereus group]MBJ7935485.1 hypothetical protein [Bacillus cereus]MCU5503807.1 hypothetical protein [Bacillus cereus]MDR5047789.1 hypothetical protein [Bacillus thuringiensis]PES56088.1 hypothetical protein CN499_06590 [Bacillus thuringiensis]PGC56567.1 hypothetical protein COM24_07085 [Bacillus toyonensis]
MSEIFERALKELPEGISFDPSTVKKVAGLIIKMDKEIEFINEGTHPFIENHTEEEVAAFKKACEKYIQMYGKAFTIDHD